MADGDHIIIPQRVVANDFKRQLEHYRLTTAEILYRIPDHPQLLQSFIWQDLDHISSRDYQVIEKELTIQ